jgi:hypothetical protein
LAWLGPDDNNSEQAQTGEEQAKVRWGPERLLVLGLACITGRGKLEQVGAANGEKQAKRTRARRVQCCNSMCKSAIIAVFVRRRDWRENVGSEKERAGQWAVGRERAMKTGGSKTTEVRNEAAPSSIAKVKQMKQMKTARAEESGSCACNIRSATSIQTSKQASSEDER